MSDDLRRIGEAWRIGQPVIAAAAGLHDLGDEILAGLEAVELVDAIEYEIREEAAFRGVCNESTTSTALAWEHLRENIEEERDKLTAIREALEATGALSPADRTTDLAALITALFAT